MSSRIADVAVPPRCNEMIRAGALVAINTSGGKDSQAMTILLSRMVPPTQLVAVHAPLGEVEWPGTVEHIEATIPAGVPLIFAPVASGTGCRRSEVLNLRWRDIGADAINLRDSKTGPRAVPLGKAARAHIGALPGARDPDAFLIPQHAEGRGLWVLTNCWRTVCADANLGGLRLHDLRHTAASQAVMAGEGLSLVGRLLGHRRHRTTASYAHLADGHLVEAAERVGNVIARAMGNGVGES